MRSRAPSTSARAAARRSASCEKKVGEDPQDANSWRDLATAYEQKQRTQDAVNALERYTALRPKDDSGLSELASQYTTLARGVRDRLAERPAGGRARVADDDVRAPEHHGLREDLRRPEGPPGSDRPAAPDAGLDEGLDRLHELPGRTEEGRDDFKKLASLTPTDVTVQYQLGQAAQAAGDYPTAIKAYKKFLKLAPTDVDAPQVRQLLQVGAEPGGYHRLHVGRWLDSPTVFRTCVPT